MPRVLTVSLLLVLCLAATPARAQDVFFKLTGYGITGRDKVERFRYRGRTYGKIHALDHVTVEKTTRDIPARLDLGFGFTFNLRSGVVKSLPVKLVITHPPMIDPKTGLTMTERSRLGRFKVEPGLYWGFTFDHPWELVPGPWTFEVYHEGSLVTRQEFNVYIP